MQIQVQHIETPALPIRVRRPGNLLRLRQDDTGRYHYLPERDGFPLCRTWQVGQVSREATLVSAETRFNFTSYQLAEVAA